jgi:hypothetical protein
VKAAAQFEKLAHGRGLVLLFVPDEIELPRQVQGRGFHRHQAAAAEGVAQGQARDAANPQA